jgi:two-component system cell cycle sensor histidine kinase/response regulator CckA
MTILLVEDDPAMRELTRDILRRNGFTVLTADSDCQALWLWSRHAHQINLLVTDLMIPNRTTGVELAKKLLRERPDLPVLYVSGFGREIGEGDTAFLRKSPFLQKPYSPSALIQTVFDCLDQDR